MYLSLVVYNYVDKQYLHVVDTISNLDELLSNISLVSSQPTTSTPGYITHFEEHHYSGVYGYDH